jgi:cyclic beta-1,2-glucan synthetase
VERDDVRVPDAPPGHAQLSGDAARPELPDGGAPPEEYGAERGVPWGISESGYNVVDRPTTTSTRPSASPASASSAGWPTTSWSRRTPRPSRPWWTPRGRPGTSAAGPGGLEGAYGYYEAVDYTRVEAPAEGTPAPKSRRATVIRSYLAHHQGMTLVALANALLGDPMVKRFHADPRVRPRSCCCRSACPAVADHAAAPGRGDAHDRRARPASASRRFRSPAHRVPATRSSSPTATTRPWSTNAGGGASFCRGRVVTR